ncbi:acylphosphatase [Salisaeta longa]|uniref:acylphosphatase n=1 Tax=Salisaeta longa TaxID=503170 RepID=UPI0003B78A68|nr:acylphosphatase [Salisaeta longa]
MAETAQRIKAHITGRVQGVGFRHFTTTTARRLGVTGWVRNEPDGSVRLVAEGPADDLQALVEAVHEGPPAARVDDVTSSRGAAEDAFSQFEVRHH